MGNGKKPLNALLEFAKTKKEPFAQLYASQIKDPAFMRLPLGTRYFYLVCRAYASSSEGRRLLSAIGKNRGKQYDFNTMFAFPTTSLREYGYSNAQASRYFKELEQAGLIKNVERFYTRSANIWRFVSEWHQSAQAKDQAGKAEKEKPS